MAKTKQKELTVRDIVALSNELTRLRDEIETLKGARDLVQATLLDAMKQSELKSVKSTDGTLVYLAMRRTLVVDNPVAYTKFAKEHGFVRESVDERAVTAWAKANNEPPAGARFDVIEYMSTKRSSKEGDTEATG